MTMNTFTLVVVVGTRAAGLGGHAGVVGHASRVDAARYFGDGPRRRVSSDVRLLLVPLDRRQTRIHATVPSLQSRAHGRGDRGARRGRDARESALSEAVSRPGDVATFAILL